MKKDKKEIPCVFYFYLHSKLYEGSLTKEANIKELKKSLGLWRLPRKIRPLILKELELLGLIKKSGRFTVIFERPKFNEEDCNNYYETLNIIKN